jgi:hypothetical protein
MGIKKHRRKLFVLLFFAKMKKRYPLNEKIALGLVCSGFHGSGSL